MKGMEIVWQEAAHILRGVVPLTLITFGIFALLGYGGWQTALSLVLGAAYTMLLFIMIGKNAVKATYFTPEGATKRVHGGYMFRYVLTGVLVILAIKIPFINPLAAVAPLFFPKLVLIFSGIFCRKGG